MRKTLIFRLFILIFFIPIISNAQTDTIVGELVMPEFPGGSELVNTFLAKYIKYPDAARDADIQGRVIVKYIVDSTGKVVDPVVIGSVHPLLDSAAIAVIKKMPRWKPGTLDGKPANIYFTLPITFRLEYDRQR